jgi:hypothetical protein
VDVSAGPAPTAAGDGVAAAAPDAGVAAAQAWTSGGRTPAGPGVGPARVAAPARRPPMKCR